MLFFWGVGVDYYINNGYLNFWLCCQSIVKKGSRTITPDKNCSPTLTGGGNFSRRQLSGCPPTLKLTLTLTQPSWHSDVVTTLSQRRCWRCHNVVARPKMRVVPTSVSDVVTTSLSNVVKTLPQRCYNIKHWISTRPFYYGLFWFLSLHWNVKVTKVLSGIKHASFLFRKTLYL